MVRPLSDPRLRSSPVRRFLGPSGANRSASPSSNLAGTVVRAVNKRWRARWDPSGIAPDLLTGGARPLQPIQGAGGGLSRPLLHGAPALGAFAHPFADHRCSMVVAPRSRTRRIRFLLLVDRRLTGRDHAAGAILLLLHLQGSHRKAGFEGLLLRPQSRLPSAASATL